MMLEIRTVVTWSGSTRVVLLLTRMETIAFRGDGNVLHLDFVVSCMDYVSAEIHELY